MRSMRRWLAVGGFALLLCLSASACFTFDNVAELQDQTSLQVDVTDIDSRADRVKVTLVVANDTVEESQFLDQEHYISPGPSASDTLTFTGLKMGRTTVTAKTYGGLTPLQEGGVIIESLALGRVLAVTITLAPYAGGDFDSLDFDPSYPEDAAARNTPEP